MMVSKLLTTPRFLAGWAHYIPMTLKFQATKTFLGRCYWSIDQQSSVHLVSWRFEKKIHRCTRESHGEKGGSITHPSDTSRDFLYIICSNDQYHPPVPSKTKLNHLVRRTECKRLPRILIRSLVFESLAADLKNLRSESPKSPKIKFNTRNQPKKQLQPKF